MNRIITALLAIAAIFYCTSCSKSNAITPVDGTINGVPATTLYGNSHKLTDYILLSKNAALKEIAYYGQIYYYRIISSPSGILITISSNAVVKGSLDTVNSKITLTIDSSLHSTVFVSKIYTAQ